MERIIRSNAVKTSLERGNRDNPDKLSSDTDPPPLANIYEKRLLKNPEKHGRIYGGANSEFTVGIRVSSNIDTSTNTNSDNWSTLQAMFDQTPSAIPSTVLLGSIAFFTVVLTWICSLTIEEVSHLRGKFIPSIDLQKVSKVTSQEVTMAVETQAQQNHSSLKDELQTQKQQMTSIQTRLNHIKAVRSAAPLESSANPQSIGQLDLMYAAESSKGLMLPSNTSKNQFFAVFTADNTVDSLKLNQSAIQALQSLRLSATQQQIQKLTKDVTQLQSKLVETKNRINTIESNLKQRLLSTSTGEIIDKPKKSSTREVFPSTPISDIASTSLVLMTTLPYQQAQFFRPGDRVQISGNAYGQHDENIILGKVLSIIPEPDTKISQEHHAAQFKIVMKQDPPIKKPLYPLKANQMATARIISRHRIADMFFDTNN
jgi:hypothetical protein